MTEELAEVAIVGTAALIAFVMMLGLIPVLGGDFEWVAKAVAATSASASAGAVIATIVFARAIAPLPARARPAAE